MKNILILQKKEGQTPLESLENFRSKHKEYIDIKMTYAGRLDPMASGLLVVLAGEETKNKEKYLGLNKEYEFEVLFGFTTDTYDILGKVVSSQETMLSKIDIEKLIKKNLKQFTGKFEQKYPMYSSKTVKGKKLFEYARDGEDVDAPSREVYVSVLKFLKLRKISSANLFKNIEKRILKVKGDFRQKEILKVWNNKLSKASSQYFFVGSFRIKCGTGTYVRSIANNLGEKINIPTLAFSIKRTKIGKWSKISS